MGDYKNIPKFRFDIAQKLVPVPEGFVQSSSGLFVPFEKPGHWALQAPQPVPAPPPEPPYEVNMMEALVGWKSWAHDDGTAYHCLTTRGYKWPFDAPLEAACKISLACKEIPNENHSCGIYAADDRELASEFHDDESGVMGQVYGWGRYIRANSGWRSQFAYPKCFYLKQHQANVIEWLRLYHVPIYIEQPQLIYNPEEDGYEYRREEENWNCGTAEESATSEDQYPGYEEE